MAGVRKDLATLGQTWSPEILWYARAVNALKQRAPNDPTGWVYLAAIHGIDPAGWVRDEVIPSEASLPPQSIQEVDFDQCQHAGWFFLPWHRGYLAAFEAILADWIAAQPGGPADWALPYWNYLNADNPTARNIPPEFLSTDWPDGPNNPLLAPRGGAEVLGPQPWLPRDITLNAQTTPMPYTAAPGTVGYGGAISGFSSSGDLTGAVEGNPHNLVHVMIGGIGGVIFGGTGAAINTATDVVTGNRARMRFEQGAIMASAVDGMAAQNFSIDIANGALNPILNGTEAANLTKAEADLVNARVIFADTQTTIAEQARLQADAEATFLNDVT